MANTSSIHSQIKIFGFGESEAILILNFLFHYDIDFKKKNDKDIETHYPLFKDFWEILSHTTVNLVKIKDVPHKENQLKKFSVIAGKYRTKKQTLLYHLRNAIAHGKISKDNKYVHFTDWNPWQKHESAIGKIKNEDFDNLLKIINNLTI